MQPDRSRRRRPARVRPIDPEELERRAQAEAEQRLRVNTDRHRTESSDALTALVVERADLDPGHVRPGSVFLAPSPRPGRVLLRAMVEVEMTNADLLAYAESRVTAFVEAPYADGEMPSLPAPPPPCRAATAWPRRLLYCELPLGHKGPHEAEDESWTATSRR